MFEKIFQMPTIFYKILEISQILVFFFLKFQNLSLNFSMRLIYRKNVRLFGGGFRKCLLTFSKCFFTQFSQMFPDVDKLKKAYQFPGIIIIIIDPEI